MRLCLPSQGAGLANRYKKNRYRGNDRKKEIPLMNLRAARTRSTPIAFFAALTTLGAVACGKGNLAPGGSDLGGGTWEEKGGSAKRPSGTSASQDATGSSERPADTREVFDPPRRGIRLRKGKRRFSRPRHRHSNQERKSRRPRNPNPSHRPHRLPRPKRRRHRRSRRLPRLHPLPT